jgi:hypothetical protein
MTYAESEGISGESSELNSLASGASEETSAKSSVFNLISFGDPETALIADDGCLSIDWASLGNTNFPY